MNNNNTNFIKKKLKFIWQEHSYILALFVLIIFATIFSDSFLQPQNLMNVFRRISTVGLIALGMTFVIIGGEIDLSVGAVLAMIGGVIIALFNTGLPLIISILGGVVVGAIIGFINGYIISKFRLASFIVTLATMAIARSLIVYIADGSSIIGPMTNKFTRIGNGNIGIIPIPAIIFVVAAILLHILLAKTKFGRFVYAIGDNEKAAKYSGIKVNKIRILTFVIIGVCVALAATIESSRLASISSSSSGRLYNLDAIAAVIIGGAPLSGGQGKILGTVVGVIILGVISNVMNLVNISPYLAGTVKGLIILGAVMIQKNR